MQVTERSATSAARRAQILDATIEVIAAEGFAGASFKRIDEHAGLSSTRLISYHFAGKDELMAALVGYSDTRRSEMAALLQVVMAGAGGATTDAPSDLSHLERILQNGQEQGEMRAFDVRVMATTVQRAVETVPFQLQADPDLDCAAYAGELVELFDRATGADA